MSFEIRHDTGRVGLKFSALRKRASEAVLKGTLDSLDFAVQVLQRVVRRNFPKGSGKLAASFTPSIIQKSDDTVRAGVFTSEPHARIRDIGGEIVPVNASKLAIPLDDEAKGRSPREFGDLFPVKRPGRNTLLARALGARQIQPLYVLVDRVYQEGRHYLEQAEQEAVEGVLEAMLRATVQKMRVD